MPRRWRVAPTIDLLRRSSIEHRVRPLGVVVVDPTADPGPRFGGGLEGLEIDALVLQRAPQSLDENVVHPASLAVHGDPHAGVLQDLREGQAGELAALIGVADRQLDHRSLRQQLEAV